MVNVRPPIPEPPEADQADSGSRLNVLLTEERASDSWHWSAQVCRLLKPLGIAAHLARTGHEAIDLANHHEIHAAVIDLTTPRDESDFADAGAWMLELFQRMPNRPPVVVVGGYAQTPNQINRMLQQALRLGAFSVLSRPVQLNQLLEVFQRVLERRYAGAWPAGRRVQLPIDRQN